MRLKKINFQDVQADVDLGVPVNFNTSFHTADEAPDLPIPSELPSSFRRWLPLILRSRNVEEKYLQIVRFTPSMTRLLVDASSASIHTRVLNKALAEDLEDEVGPAFESLTYPPNGLFMRFAPCSAKDGVWKVPGRAAVHSYEDIVLQLTTSSRARITMTNYLRKCVDEPLELYFLPFNERMKTEMEYRVFCAPETLDICAISQYQWHKPWRFRKKTESEMDAIAERILAGARDIRAQILNDLHEPGTHELDDMLRRQGMTFDVWYDDGRDKVELVELNTFGVRSSCGACLFHWVKDREVIYGAGDGEVEFRVAV